MPSPFASTAPALRTLYTTLKSFQDDAARHRQSSAHAVTWTSLLSGGCKTGDQDSDQPILALVAARFRHHSRQQEALRFYWRCRLPQQPLAPECRISLSTARQVSRAVLVWIWRLRQRPPSRQRSVEIRPPHWLVALDPAVVK